MHRDSWRLNSGTEEAVGVGAYFGRLEWQTDSVARVKSLVAGGAAEQAGMIDIGDAVSSPSCGMCGSVVLMNQARHVSIYIYQVPFEKETYERRRVSSHACL